MRSVIIKNSLILAFSMLLISCKNNTKNKSLTTKSIDSTIQSNKIKKYKSDYSIKQTLLSHQDSIILCSNPFEAKLKINDEKYFFFTTTCMVEFGWGWNLAYASMGINEQREAMMELKKKYNRFEFDFLLNQSRNDEFFFKIKKNKLFLVAYRNFEETSNPIFELRNGKQIQIGTKEKIKEKLIPLNIIVQDTLNTDFICKFRDDEKKYPFKISEIDFYNKN